MGCQEKLDELVYGTKVLWYILVIYERKWKHKCVRTYNGPPSNNIRGALVYY